MLAYAGIASPAWASAPTVTNLSATSVSSASANAQCSVNPGNESTEVWVTYKLDSDTWASGPVTPTAKTSISGSTTQTVVVPLSGLTVGTAYDYRCKADNSTGPIVVDTTDASFTTLNVASPTVTNNAASGVNNNSATANCTVNTNGFVTDVWVVYKENSQAWADSVPTGEQILPAGSSNVSVQVPIVGLTANTTYNYRCKADNSDGGTTQTDTNSISFTTTNSAIVNPTVTTGNETNVSSSGAVIPCTVDTGNDPTTELWVGSKLPAEAWGGPSTLNTSHTTVTDDATINVTVTGLSASTTYDYRCRVDNSVSSTINGSTLQLTTT